MKFRPLHDRVVVERIDAEAKSAGGIIIPDSAQEKPSQGKIVAVGPGGVGAVLIRTPDGN
jgi:chaperonin GroES